MSNINQYDPKRAEESRAKGAAMAEAITNIFQILRAYYPKYTLVMKTEKHELGMMREWGKTLAKSGVNQEMVKNGIERAKTYAAEDKYCNWPSLPDFMAWCHGLPDLEESYSEACRNSHNIKNWEPSHPIVALALMRVGLFNFNSMSDKEAMSKYSKHYGALRASVTAGEKLEYSKPKHDQTMSLPKSTPESRELGSKMIKEIKETLKPDAKEDRQELTQEEIEDRRRDAIERANRFMEQNKNDK